MTQSNTGASDEFAGAYFHGNLLNHTDLMAVISKYFKNQHDLSVLSDGWISVLAVLQDYEPKLFNLLLWTLSIYWVMEVLCPQTLQSDEKCHKIWVSE